MSSAHAAKKTGNPLLDNPGLSSLIFGAVVLTGFLYALYGAATSHHGGGEHAAGGEHPAASAAPAGSAAHGGH